MDEWLSARAIYILAIGSSHIAVLNWLSFIIPTHIERTPLANIRLYVPVT